MDVPEQENKGSELDGAVRHNGTATDEWQLMLSHKSLRG
jgi:hypothetical protein